MPVYLFEVGQVVATAAVAEFCTQTEFLEMLDKHRSGEWGQVPPEDAKENDLSVKEGYRILSAYDVRGKTVWLITEAQDDNGRRQSSTFLYPDEY